MANESQDVLWLHSHTRISITELEQFSGLPQDVIRDLVELGALAPVEAGEAQYHFSASCVARVRTVARLRSDLELETPALALALSFLERIGELEARVRELDAQLARPPRR